MNQTLFDLSTETTTASACDRTGFQIGWDHAHHGLVPPPQWMLDGTPVCQGWMAAKAVFGRRTLSGGRSVRQWLALRLQAWHARQAFDTTELTPNYLGQLNSARCPVLRQPLGGAPHEAQAAVFVRLNEAAGWAAGHVAMISRAAADRARGLSIAGLVQRARHADDADAPAWWRLATLRAFATPLPFIDAVRLPLAVLPPNRVRLLNAAQGLQALITAQFLGAGWGSRLQAMAALLPEHTLRQDFNLFVGALVPRVLEAQSKQLDLRTALEDAWLGERVQRRWQHLAFSLGEAGVVALLDRATQAGLAVQRTLNHAAERATEGWGLDPAAAAPGPWPAVVRQPDRRLGGRTAGRPPKNRSATTGARLA